MNGPHVVRCYLGSCPSLSGVAHPAESPDRAVIMLDGLGLILERRRTLDTLADHTHEYAPAVTATVEGHIDGPEGAS